MGLNSGITPGLEGERGNLSPSSKTAGQNRDPGGGGWFTSFSSAEVRVSPG